MMCLKTCPYFLLGQACYISCPDDNPFVLSDLVTCASSCGGIYYRIDDDYNFFCVTSCNYPLHYVSVSQVGVLVVSMYECMACDGLHGGYGLVDRMSSGIGY